MDPSESLLDTLIFFAFKFVVWTGYLLTPAFTVVFMVNGLDPQFYLVEYIRTAYPLIWVLVRAVTLNNALLLLFGLEMGLVIARFSAMTVALYEAERIMALVFESVYIIINIAINVARLIEKIVRINSRRIQAGLFHHQFVYYVKIQMAVQSVEDIIGMTM